MYNKRDGGVSPVIATILILGLVVVLAAIVLPAAYTTMTDFAVQEKKTVGVTVQSDEDGFHVNLMKGKDYAELVSYTVITTGSSGDKEYEYQKKSDGTFDSPTLPSDTSHVEVVGTFSDGTSEVVYSGKIQGGSEAESTVYYSVYLNFINKTGEVLQSVKALSDLEDGVSYEILKDNYPNIKIDGYTYTKSDIPGKIDGSKIEGRKVYENVECTPITYTVKFDGNGSTSGTMANQTLTYDVYENLTERGYEKTGSEFLGWTTNKDSSVVEYKDKASVKNLCSEQNAVITLYAIWKSNGINLIFDFNDGVTKSVTVPVTNGHKYGEYIPWGSMPARIGYTPEGWFNGETAISENDVVNLDKDTTLKLKWTQVTTITLKCNNADYGTDGSAAIQQGLSKTTTLKPAVVGTRILEGYYTAAEGGDMVMDKSGFLKAGVSGYTSSSGVWTNTSSSVTLYAHWKKVTITFYPNADNMDEIGEYPVTAKTVTPSGSYTQTIFAGEETSLRSCGFTMTNIVADGVTYGEARFSGWGTKSGTSTSVVYSDMAYVTTTVDLSLYAVWIMHKYEIVLCPDSSNPSKNVSVYIEMDTNNPNDKKSFPEHLYVPTTVTNFQGWNAYDKTQSNAEIRITDATGHKITGLDQNFSLSRSTTTRIDDYTYQIVLHPYIAETYTVVFNGNKGTYADGSTSLSFTKIADSSNTVEATDNFAREGYALTSWNTNEAGTGSQFDIGDRIYILHSGSSYKVYKIPAESSTPVYVCDSAAGTLNLYAQWEAAQKWLSLDYNYEGSPGAVKWYIKSGDHVHLPTKENPDMFTREGYEFIGWSKNTSGTPLYSKDEFEYDELGTADSATLYAVWGRDVTLTFVWNGEKVGTFVNGYIRGTGSPQSGIVETQKYVSGDPQALYRTNYSFYGMIEKCSGREGTITVLGSKYGYYLFDKWNTKANGSGISVADGETVTIIISNGKYYLNSVSSTNMMDTNEDGPVLYAQWRLGVSVVLYYLETQNASINKSEPSLKKDWEIKGSDALVLESSSTVRYVDISSFGVDTDTYIWFSGYYSQGNSGQLALKSKVTDTTKISLTNSNVYLYGIRKASS